MHSKTWLKLIIAIIFLTHTIAVSAQDSGAIEGSEDPLQIVRVAIQSQKGTEAVRQKWSATMEYLSENLDGYSFKLLPLESPEEMRSIVESKAVDFIITDPSEYIDLEYKFGVFAIATLVNGREGGGRSMNAGLLFTSSTREDINDWEDIKGKSIMGVGPDNFAGWQMALVEMLARDIDPYRDCSEIVFSPDGYHQSVVYSVLYGNVDIGTVRSGVVEGLIEKGLIDEGAIKPLNSYLDSIDHMHTTMHYPGPPFSSLKDTPILLSEKVRAVLMHLEADSEAALDGDYSGWTLALDYSEVRNLLRVIKAPPYTNALDFTFIDVLRVYWKPILIVLIFSIIAFFSIIIISILNRRLQHKTADLKTLSDTLEQKVMIRTEDLRKEIILRKKSEKESILKQKNIQIILDSMIDGVYIVNQQYDIQYVNPVLVKDFGNYERKKCYKYFHNREEVCPWCKNKEVLAGKSVQWEWFSEKNGKTYDLIDTPIQNIDGSISKLEIFRDITERKQFEQEQEKYQEKLENLVAKRTEKLEERNIQITNSQTAMRYLVSDANDIRKELEDTNKNLLRSNTDLKAFSHSVSHDLRSPIRAILGFTSKLQRTLGDSSDNEILRIMKVITDSTVKMQELIRDLLAYSEVGSHNLSRGNINMNQMVSALCSDFEVEAQDQNIKFTILDLPDFMGNHTMFKKLLFNLIDNAVKFSCPEKNSLITIGYREEDAAYYVKDEGCGFDNKFSDQVFNIFKRVHDNTSLKGTGVGLAIVKKIIEIHGGRVWSESEPGKGSVFCFTLNNSENRGEK